MDFPIVRADIDLTTLIYMIAVVLWVLGNLFSKKNKQGRKSPPQRPRPESTAEAELRDFLERMTGQRMEPEEPEPEYVEVPPRQLEPVRRAAPEPVPHRPPPPPVYIPEPERDAIKAEISEVMKSRSTSMRSAFASALKSTGSQFKLTDSNISILKQAMRSPHPPPIRPVVTRRDLKNKKVFRQAITAQIILGTPRAFETSDVPEAIRH